MAYINFKEENQVAAQQLEKRKKNNENVCKYLLKHKDQELVGYKPSPKYSYITIKDTDIGKKGVLDESKFYEIVNEDIVCAKFKNVNFRNVKFKDCKLVGCTFEDCNFIDGGVIFENCILIKEGAEQLPSLNKKDNLSCSFYNCNVYAKFLNSDISFAIFENCKILDTSFEQTFMKSTFINKCDLDMIIIKDCTMNGFKMTNYYINDLDFNDDFQTKFDEKTYFDQLKAREETRAEFEGMYMTYETLADVFKQNTLNNNFGEYYYLGKKIQRKTLKFWPKVWSYISWASCGYGERPENALYTGILLMLFFGLLYLFTGIEMQDGSMINYNLLNLGKFEFSKFLKDFNEGLNISVGSFAGVGSNEGQPSASSYMVQNIEMVLGVILMGLGIGAMTRKIVR